MTLYRIRERCVLFDILLAFAATLALPCSALADDDRWTPDDFEKPVPGAPSERPEREEPEPPDPENVPRRELEPRAAPFGARGQVAVFGGTSFGISHVSYESGAEETSAAFAPSVLYFPATHLAVGLGIHLSYDDAKYFMPSDLTETETFRFLVGPKLGYDIPLSRFVSIFPNASALFGYASVRQAVLVPYAGSHASLAPVTRDEADASIDVALPVLFHPVQNFSFGFGPRVSHDFAKDGGLPDLGAQQTTVGAALYLLGHWGGDLPAEEAHAAPPREYDSHLGSANGLVLLNDLNLGGSFTHAPASGSDAGSLAISGSVLRFFGDRFALGGGASLSYSRASGAPGTDGPHDISAYTISGSAITGYAAPLGGDVVFFPRASIAFGLDDHVIDTPGATTSDVRTDGFIEVQAFAPLDFELARHFFVGIGPFVRRDLLRFVQAGAPQNISTSIGGGLEIGTWL